MRHRLTVTLGIVGALLMGAVLTVVAAAQTDVTGTWNMTFDTDQGSTVATLNLQQEGEVLSGSLNSDQGTVEFEGGMINENKLEWVFEVDAGGAFIEIAIEGTVDGDEMTGTADFGGAGGGDWTATRAQ